MTQIKIISADTLSTLETKVNHWLKDNSNDIAGSMVELIRIDNFPTALIHYQLIG